MRKGMETMRIMLSAVTCWFIGTVFFSHTVGAADMTNGFQRDEAMQMMELSADLNDYGDSGRTRADTSNWELVGTNSKGVGSRFLTTSSRIRYKISHATPSTSCRRRSCLPRPEPPGWPSPLVLIARRLCRLREDSRGSPCADRPPHCRLLSHAQSLASPPPASA